MYDFVPIFFSQVQGESGGYIKPRKCLSDCTPVVRVSSWLEGRAKQVCQTCRRGIHTHVQPKRSQTRTIHPLAGIFALSPVQGVMVTAEDARGWTALHYACRTIARSERSDSIADQCLVKEKAEEVRARTRR